MAGKYENPKGGLNSAGRQKFGVKKGVTNYSSASEETKKRWVRWALRFTKTPRPLSKPNGEPTRYALMFNAWGEPVPKSASAVRAVHAKAVSRAKTLKMGQYATSEKAARDEDDVWDDAWLAEMEAELAETVLEIRDRLMPPAMSFEMSPTTPVLVPPRSEQPPVMITEGRDRLTLTAPVTELLQSEQAAGLGKEMAQRLYVKLRGRFVEAEKANGNGAYWSALDLEVGLPTVAFGPLNWLHDERKVVGVLSSATLVQREMAAQSGLGPHINAEATMWRWLYPQETRVVERAAEDKKLWYSMECVSPVVECAGTHGCGAQMPYLDALRREGAACSHVVNREAVRRFVDPIFQGGAIIVPPVTPGWASADLTVVREAASALESSPALSADLTDEEASQMVQQVLDFARRA